MKLQLVRDTFASDHTYGKLTILDDGATFETIERSERGPHPCVPEGVYDLVLHDTPRHPQTWALVNPELRIYHEPFADMPPDARYAILIHPANMAEQLLGCIAPGEFRGTISGVAAVLSSQAAFARLKSLVPWTNGHTLTISDQE